MPPFLTTHRHAAALDWASGHFGVISRGELAALGVPPGTVAAWVANGRLQRLHHGVYALGHTALRVEGRWRAAALAGGAKSALSHQTALLALGGWAPEHAGIHLTTTGAGRSRGELRLHRSALHPADVTVRHGLRVTTLERALVDCADELDWQELLAVADRIWELSPTRLAAARERAGARRGARRTRLLQAREEPHTRSEFERAYLRFGRRHALPRPAGVNVRVGRWVVDVLLDGLALELDGRAHHARRREMARDRQRDAELQALGYRVLRLVWEDLYAEQTPATLGRLTPLLGTRGAKRT